MKRVPNTSTNNSYSFSRACKISRTHNIITSLIKEKSYLKTNHTLNIKLRTASDNWKGCLGNIRNSNSKKNYKLFSLVLCYWERDLLFFLFSLVAEAISVVCVWLEDKGNVAAAKFKRHERIGDIESLIQQLFAFFCFVNGWFDFEDRFFNVGCF